MLNLNQKQIQTKAKIEEVAKLFGIDARWALAVAMTESSLGLNQRSPTNSLGVFQMTQVAMRDLLSSMKDSDDDLVDIVCGIAFLRLLLRRHKTIEDATNHYCDPAVRTIYLDRVLGYMKEFQGQP